MKRVLLALLCVLALCMAGCTDVNQTNSFVDLPTAEPVQQTAVPTAPDITQPPVITQTPQSTAVPAQTETEPQGEPGMENVQPLETAQPAPTVTPTESPEGGGFNG